MHLFVATRGDIFSLKFTKYRLAAGLRPDPLGELKRSPDPLAAILLRGGEGMEGKGNWRGNLHRPVATFRQEKAVASSFLFV